MSKPYPQMVGKTFLYKGEQHRIENILPVDKSTVEVVTDKRRIKVSPLELRKEFLPVDVPQKLNGQERAIVKLMEQEEEPMRALGSYLMDNVKKLATDEKFIKQAKAMNDTAKRIIELQKLKLEIVKTAVAARRRD